ncbi:helix-turn-helix transcriptional regulator [Natronoglycomyces albus]|nr:response regulator transcription factor [Natronoglycomyces albus]
MLYDPKETFVASLQPLLHSRGDETIRAGSVSSVTDATDVDAHLVAIDSINRSSRLRQAHGPVFLITDRDDGKVLRQAFSCQAAGLSGTHRMPADLLAAIDQAISGHPYFDRDLLRAALRPQPELDRDAARQLVSHLTPREDDVLRRIMSGESTSKMAAAMGVSISTVRSHIQNVLAKLGVHSRLAAQAFVINYDVTTVAAGAPQYS